MVLTTTPTAIPCMSQLPAPTNSWSTTDTRRGCRSTSWLERRLLAAEPCSADYIISVVDCMGALTTELRPEGIEHDVGTPDEMYRRELQLILPMQTTVHAGSSEAFLGRGRIGC